MKRLCLATCRAMASMTLRVSGPAAASASSSGVQQKVTWSPSISAWLGTGSCSTTA
jgi:hypothetical protein